MVEHIGEVPKMTEREAQRAWARRTLLEAAQEGQTVHMQLMIGDTPVENGMSFEAVRDELYRLMEQGLIQLDSQYRSWITEKGIEALNQ